MRLLILFLSAAVSLGARAALDASYPELDAKRIEAIEAMLPEQASGFGAPSTRREAWTNAEIVAALEGKKVVGHAEKMLTQEFPAWDDEAYLTFSKTGSRGEGEAMLGRRSGWLYPLVMAECIENKGRFLSKINFLLNEYAGEKSWTLPAHDRSLGNYKGTAYDVDLRSSWFASELAQALFLLGDKLDLDARTKILAAMEQRVFKPVRASLRTGKGNFWLKADHNWNSVCLNGVTCAALAAMPGRHERAVFVAAAEHYGRHYLAGYDTDGYCSEGTGYWNYGFGNFINLRERLLQVSGGKIDSFNDPKIRAIALFGFRIQMADSIAPPYADCHTGSRPDDWFVRYCNLTLGLGVRGYDPPLRVRLGNLNTACMDAFPNSTSVRKLAGPGENTVGPRSYFDKVGVLICRPMADSTNKLNASIKAGGNGNHSHNDVGSFIVQLGKELLVGEPGGPKHYSADTFSAKRYQSKILNSFGHPVPVIAGKLQVDATKIHPKVIQTNFTPAQDEIVIDMTCAYDEPSLKKLIRTFRYSREGAGSVIVEDMVVFDSPQSFEISLPTHAKWKQTGERVIEFSSGGEAIRAGIQTPDGFDVASEEIENSSPACTRIGLKLKKPVQSATIRMAFVPVQ